ncbi:MAG: CinA family protein [Actinomycetales bacterium]|nr:CinA family protein [Actinomycetales bacterium]
MAMSASNGPGREAAELVDALRARGATLAVAESLTGGLLAATIVDVPGASAVFRGGVVAYATELKHRLLGVDAALLAERGPVDPEVAAAMAAGVRARLGPDASPATLGLATTGVAGPDPQDGHAPGEVWIGVATAAGAVAHRLDAAGDRAAIRRAAVSECLRRGLDALAE